MADKPPFAFSTHASWLNWTGGLVQRRRAVHLPTNDANARVLAWTTVERDALTSDAEKISPLPARRDALQAAVLAWASVNGRPFPWREPGSTPYQILIAELLLKRTTAIAASRLYTAFLRKYPTLRDLATTSEDELARDLVPVGLYVQRAKTMAQLSQYLDEHEAGTVPDSLEQLKMVPGLGNYSTRAILSFGHRVPAAVVDANVARILQRVFQTVMPRRASQRLLQSVADSLMPKRDHQMYNFGLLDIGSLVCRYVNPKCDSCPLRGLCDYASGGDRLQEGVETPRSRLRQIRLSKRVSLVKLAQASRVAKSTIINIEAGRTHPRPDTIHRLATALLVRPDEVAPEWASEI